MHDSDHAAPDYQHRFGWAEMKRDLAEIRAEAKELRRQHAGGKKQVAKKSG